MNLRWWAFSTTIIALTGILGIRFVVNQLYPTGLTVVLFFVLLFVTFGAGVVPLSAFGNHRFATKKWQKRDPYRLIRHAIEGGMLSVTIVYLQLIQALDWTIAAVLVSVFILMETFFLTRA